MRKKTKNDEKKAKNDKKRHKDAFLIIKDYASA